MRIAIVDDHALMRAGLSGVVSRQTDWTIVWSGGSLAELLDSNTAADVLILDLDFGGEPVDPGLVEAAKSRGFAILVVSALASERTVRTVARIGVAGFVPKTHPDEDFLEAVRMVAAGGRWIPPAVMQALVVSDAPNTPQLTPQERRVLELYSSGMTVQSVARIMSLAPATVHFHLKRIRAKFAAADRPSPGPIELYRNAVAFGLVD